MEDLIRKRGRSKGNITRIENFIAEHENDENLHNNELVIGENILIKAFNDYCRIQDCIEDENESQIVDREVVEERYVAVHSKLRTLIQKTVNMVSATNEVVAQALVDKNSNLADSQKFLYLKSVVKNEPLSLINELSITDGNYTIALDILKKRYNNKMAINNSHIESLLEIEVQKENSFSMRDFITKIKQHFNALKAMSVPIDSWDLILVYIFSNKLYFHTHKAYELERDSAKTPKLEEFLEFIDKRCSALESVSQSENKSRSNKSPNQTRSQQVSHTVTNNSSRSSKANIVQLCIYCKGKTHSIYRCSQFSSQTIQEKRDFVTKNRLCFNCLGTKHIVSQCTSERCRSCSGRHHTLLHENPTLNNDRQFPQVNVISSENPSSRQIVQENSNNTSIDSNPHSQLLISSTHSSVQKNWCFSNQENKTHVLLATARVNLISDSGNKITARALLDSASQTTFITSEIMKRLKTKTQQSYYRCQEYLKAQQVSMRW
ncbi:hypothetical protein JTB14_015331 [Gonioctena quinquepunctata]|nr:hypothetical protein JTB14_015331 [Gonioctena quinquepunctata]